MIDRFAIDPPGWNIRLAQAIRDTINTADVKSGSIAGIVRRQTHAHFRAMENGGSVNNAVGPGGTKTSISWSTARHPKTMRVRRAFGLGATPMLQIRPAGVGGVIEHAVAEDGVSFSSSNRIGSLFHYSVVQSEDAEKARINQFGLRVDSFVRGMNVPPRPSLFWDWDMLNVVIGAMRSRFARGVRRSGL